MILPLKQIERHGLIQLIGFVISNNLISKSTDLTMSQLESLKEDLLKNANKDLIGFQVVGTHDDMPPKECFSFQVYSLEACMEFILNPENGGQSKWRLIPITEDTIEDPTIMEGSI